MIRTFIALAVPIDIRNRMGEVQSRLKQGGAVVRWESPEKLHATIKFLGDIEEGRLQQVLDMCDETIRQFADLDVRFESLGVFPNLTKPCVVWIGCSDLSGSLEKIKGRLDQRLAPLGFEIEKRRFQPHVTLGRVKEYSHQNDLTSLMENVIFEPQSP